MSPAAVNFLAELRDVLHRLSGLMCVAYNQEVLNADCLLRWRRHSLQKQTQRTPRWGVFFSPLSRRVLFAAACLCRRSFDEEIRDEPLVYRLLEAVLHYGEVRTLKAKKSCNNDQHPFVEVVCHSCCTLAPPKRLRLTALDGKMYCPLRRGKIGITDLFQSKGVPVCQYYASLIRSKMVFGMDRK